MNRLLVDCEKTNQIPENDELSITMYKYLGVSRLLFFSQGLVPSLGSTNRRFIGEIQIR